MNDYSTNQTRKRAIRAAKDFHYCKDVIKMLEKAKTASEINRIMKNARDGVIDYKNFMYMKPKKGQKKVEFIEELPEGVYRCSEVVESCKYAKKFTYEGTKYCDYLCMTGQRRGCPGERCDKYEKRGSHGNNIVRLEL